LQKIKTDDVTSVKPVLSEVEGAGVQAEKLDSRWSLSRTEFTPHFNAGMRGGNPGAPGVFPQQLAGHLTV